ncbi:RNA polymerase sigma factor, sigma-70 family [Sporobacter termitidis DSM 10068]|uniref:RNA polymerase sigma factor, sigma-70 family n=2 Tax=Sporobacter TaxID=44748 RepID=A0A1M5URF4_9FIRM|nr:RNA polymerase sigma factor, sigma-70 family [Sporobacter termitidis DSM 10068]
MNKRQTTELTDDIPAQETLEMNFILKSEKAALYKAIHALNQPMREVIHMRLTGEFSFAEIGEILGKSENWARTTFYRAKQKIMEAL